MEPAQFADFHPVDGEARTVIILHHNPDAGTCVLADDDGRGRYARVLQDVDDSLVEPHTED